jgi:uncharacterized YigZ family protein
MSDTPYRIPAAVHRTAITVVNSRFITTIAPAPSVDAAKSFLAQIRGEMPDASHHVHAFRVGYGNSVIEGMSDDGEPSGTSGPPTLAVLRGADIGDCIVVTTRYFGGTKLGTGGLVRAYSDSARTALETLPTELKIAKQILGIEVPYNLFEQVERLVEAHDGITADKTFAANVTLCVTFPVSQIADFTAALSELSAGRITPVILDDA